MAARIRGRSPEAKAQRRRLVIEVARQFAVEGGPEAVQMRAVAASAQMTLATLYRLAPSKIALLSMVASDQVRRLAAYNVENPIVGGTRGERVSHVYKRVFVQIMHEPNLGRAIFSVFGGVGVLELDQIANEDEITLAHLARAAAGSDGEPVSAEEEKLLLMARLVWGGAVGEWLSGLLPTDAVNEMIDLSGAQVDAGRRTV